MHGATIKTIKIKLVCLIVTMRPTKAHTSLELQHVLIHVGDCVLKYIVILTKCVHFVGRTVTTES